MLKTKEERQKLADLVIEHIFDRSSKGFDKNGKPFPKYSKEYINSLDFKNAGKTPGRVDLQLSGDMLAALQMLDERPGEIDIGYEKGTEENARAEGNIIGSYGGKAKASRARDFLGIQSKKLKDLIEYVRNS